MPQPKASRVFSFFGGGGGGGGGGDSVKKVNNRGGSEAVLPSLKLHTDRDVYRPGDPVLVTIEIGNNSPSSGSAVTQPNNVITSNSNAAEYSLLIERLTFEMKGIEKLDTQWFTTQKLLPDSKQRRGEYVFMDCSATHLVSNQIVSPRATKTCAVQVAYQMEEELKKTTPMRNSIENITQSKRTFVDASRGKSIDKPRGSSYVSNKSRRPNASSSSQASSNSNCKTKCYTCHGYGHLSFQCSTNLVLLLKRKF